MPTSLQRSAYEEGLNRAHRGLYWAMKRAADIDDEGAFEDLKGMMEHVSAMMDESLRNKKHRSEQIRGQLEL